MRLQYHKNPMSPKTMMYNSKYTQEVLQCDIYVSPIILDTHIFSPRYTCILRLWEADKAMECHLKCTDMSSKQRLMTQKLNHIYRLVLVISQNTK